MRKLNRRSEHRLSLLRNLSISLIEHGKIQTTLPKAKELRSFLEPIITRSKENSLHNRRIILKKLFNNHKATEKLFEIGQTMKKRPGGYLRIIKRSNSQKGIVMLVESKKTVDKENILENKE